MIDQILGRPSPSLRRSQIFLVIFFWIWRLYKGDGSHPIPLIDVDPSATTSAAGPHVSGRVGRAGPHGVAAAGGRGRRRTLLWKLWIVLAGRNRLNIGWIAKLNDKLRQFTPYQIILSSLTLVYAFRHLDDLFGLGAPEPLARMYSRSYYRATWVNTAFDAGFASAMTIRPKWLKDLMSFVFALYYMVYASEGDEVLRRFRALCTVEMLRVTWEKTNNPYVRMITWFHRPSLPIVEHVLIPRPSTSSRSHLPPVQAMLFFNGTKAALEKATQLVVDFPGGGFIAMGPECHEERLRLWAKRTGKPVLGVDYGKAPEYPYPWAIEEGFDAYRTLMETKGRALGIQSGKLGIVLTGDSAGGNICATIMLRILEHPTPIPRPVSMILAYPALDFNFTSWMSPSNLRVLRTEQSETHIPGLVHGKDHMRHKSPLSVVDDTGASARRKPRAQGRQKSWGQMIGEKIPGLTMTATSATAPGASDVSPDKRPSGPRSPTSWTASLPRNMSAKVSNWLGAEPPAPDAQADKESSADEKVSSDASDSEDETATVRAGMSHRDKRREADKSLKERVKTPKTERPLELPRVESPLPMKDIESGQLGDKAVVNKKKRKAPIGTRLTMTSRVGYFQDRVITPSMMRAMAILYVGPRRNPDFETDYYISPILSPPHLLAHFPPVYLICGERDPFVDDTVILSGKIREAKRRRRAEAELKLESRSAKFGETLRMSTSQSAPAGHAPDHILRETDEDWVQMRIIEGWGHGFMQMTSLMREVDGVLTEMADWIDESFEKAADLQKDVADVAAAHVHAQQQQEQQQQQQLQNTADHAPDPIISPVEHLPLRISTHVKPTTEYKKTDSASIIGYPDLGGLITHDHAEGDENEGVLAFTPKTRRKNSLPPSKFNPVPRRPSKEALDLHRNNSAPKFDVDETGSSGEAVMLKTPPMAHKALPMPIAPKGSGAFAFFNPSRAARGSGNTSGSGTVSAPTSAISPIGKSPHPSIFAPYGAVPTSSSAATPPAGALGGSGGISRRASSSATRDAAKPTNSLVAAAVAGARAASPALAAAGLVPQQVETVSEAELFRRRRMEAVFGMGDTESAVHSEDEGDDGE